MSALSGLAPDAGGGIRRAIHGYSPLARIYRRFRPRWLWERTSPLGRVTRRYVDQHGLVVRAGLFQGLRFPDDAVGRSGFLPAKLVGTYEHELSDALARASEYDLFVDLGSGDGYFCAGVAATAPGVAVIGYETDPSQRDVAHALAALNGVGVELRGTVDAAELNSLPAGRMLLLVDLEGYEYELLDPSGVPRLADATMVVECHPGVHPDVVEVLTDRFRATHRAELIEGGPRTREDVPELAGWEEAAANIAVSEGRPRYPVWMVLTPSRDPH